MIKSCETGVLCKLDIEKAYDHVNREFLIYLLRSYFRAKLLMDSVLQFFSVFLRFGEW
jgi:hypothetical protein